MAVPDYPLSPATDSQRAEGIVMWHLNSIACLMMMLLGAASGYAQSVSRAAPLTLTIHADAPVYSPTDEIHIQYAIENTSSESTGFYLIADETDMAILASDASGKPYTSYYDPEVQRFKTPIYPFEYVVLKPHEERSGSLTCQLKKGEIKTWDPKGNGITYKAFEGGEKTIYDGFYLVCPSVHSDSIWLSGLSEGEITLTAAYTMHDPNPEHVTLQDCEKAGIALGTNSEDANVSTLILSVIGNLDMSGPGFEQHFNLAVYCQHQAALSRNAWIGSITSNRISVKVAGKQ